MKGIVCEQPGQLIMKELEPPAVKPGEVLVRIRRIGICGTDLHAFKGEQPYFTYPRILGHELSGEIVEVRDHTHGLRRGDPVVIIPYLECGQCIACKQGKTNCCVKLKLFGVHLDGGMQEYMSIPADHLIKSEKLNLDQMAMVECLGIGAHAVRRSQIKEGEVAMVIGAGPIGIVIVQFAKKAGAKVIALEMMKERLEFCRDRLKVDYVIDVQGDPAKEIESITNRDYPHVVFDATGSAQSMMNAFNLVSHGGRLVLVSLVKENITFYDPDFHRRELTLMSSRNATREDMERVIHSIEKGEVDASSFITHRATFDRLIDQFESWMKPETRVIKGMVEL